MTALTTIPTNTAATFADNLAEGALAPNTKRGLLSDQRVFQAFCDRHALSAMPADPETVADFVRAMGELKKPGSIRRYLASIAHIHRAAKAPNPCEAQAVKLSMAALARVKGVAQKQANPLNREHIEIALRSRTRLSLRDLRQRAIVAVAYDSMCRASELVELQVRDITPTANGAATILVRRGKTDQQGEGSDRYLHTDTMNHVRAWLLAAGLVDGELFRAVLKGSRMGGPLHECEISRALREIAPRGAGHVSAHSTRIGACQDMVKKGIEVGAIMQAAGWRTSAMVAKYNRKAKAETGGAAQLAAKQGR